MAGLGFPIRRELLAIGLSESAVRKLEQLSDFADTVTRLATVEETTEATNAAVDALQEEQEDQNLSLASLDGRIDVFEDFSATDPRYAKKAGDTFGGAVDVQALLQCDSFRIDAAPSVSAATASTHKLAISCNGVNYFVLLSNV